MVEEEEASKKDLLFDSASANQHRIQWPKPSHSVKEKLPFVQRSELKVKERNKKSRISMSSSHNEARSSREESQETKGDECSQSGGKTTRKTKTL